MDKNTIHEWKLDYGCVGKRHCATVVYVMGVKENTMNIVDVCTFVHAINNLVLFKLRHPATGKRY